ncbi:hypothetical protein [Nocardia sp. NBC_00416]
MNDAPAAAGASAVSGLGDQLLLSVVGQLVGTVLDLVIALVVP